MKKFMLIALTCLVSLTNMVMLAQNSEYTIDNVKTAIRTDKDLLVADEDIHTYFEEIEVYYHDEFESNSKEVNSMVVYDRKGNIIHQLEGDAAGYELLEDADFLMSFRGIDYYVLESSSDKLF